MITGDPSTTLRATTAPLSPPYSFGPPAFPPPVPPAPVPARRRRAVPIALGVIAALGIAGTIAGYAGKASSDSRASALARSNRNLDADLDDAEADISDLEERLDESSVEVLSLTDELTDAEAELERVQGDLDAARDGDDGAGAPTVAGVPSLNDGLVSSFEADLIAEQTVDLGFARPDLELSDYQAVADRVCSIESVWDLTDVVEWAGAEHASLDSFEAAAFVVGGAGGAACQAHLADVLGM